MTFRFNVTKISSVKLEKKILALGRDFINLGVPPDKVIFKR